MSPRTEYADAARHAGIVGAGGGGFPTYVKLQTHADTVIANGAECEPLLHKDKQLMLRHADRMIRGLKLAAVAVGAKRCIVGVKAKYPDVVDAVTEAARTADVEIHTLGNFYPSGDEYVLVYEATRRLIPTGGLPGDVGCLVQNSETLVNLAAAVDDGRAVTESWVTITGAVKQPVTVCVPVGVPYRTLIDATGGASVSDPVILDGGAMMGQLVEDLDTPVTKTTAGLLVLDRTHTLIVRRTLPRPKVERVGLSACDQCYYCTEFCPRFLLGHPIQPHKVMRSLGFVGTSREYWSEWAAACCECNLCSLYACPEDLDPKNICTWSKREVLAGGYKFPEPRQVDVHPLAESRKVPLPKLIGRLGLADYDRPAPFSQAEIAIDRLTLRLDQHRGQPATAQVAEGQSVAAGDMIADVPADKLGCPVHAPRAGTVREVTEQTIVIETT
jgi:Na+-translocating ferredoxin:NAD+ oxidoreductase RnfC subunit